MAVMDKRLGSELLRKIKNRLYLSADPTGIQGSQKGKEFGFSFLGSGEGLMDGMVHSGIEMLCLI